MTVTDPDILAWRGLADRFRPKPRRWASPLTMATALDRAFIRSPALNLIDAELVKLTDTTDGRLMVFMPAQEGKSTAASLWYPLWLLAYDPTLRIGIVSYGADLAESFGKAVKRVIEAHPDIGIRLRQDSRAAGRWETDRGGGLYCVGLDGGLSGRPLDILIYDDVIKDRRQAESAAHRKACWDHWEQVGRPRLSARGRVVVLLTRWHTDDLPGRLKQREPDRWRVVEIPAVAGEWVADQRAPGGGRWVAAGPDPLGRAPGVEMVSARRRRPGYFLDLAQSMARYAWLSIYQQKPTAAAGTMFARPDWRYWQWDTWPHRINLGGSVRDLRDCWRYLTADLAASTRTSADWTVAAVWALTMDRQLVCLGRVRARVEQAGHWELVRPLSVEWGTADMGVESAMMGTTLVRQAVRAGLNPFDLRADADKVTRAIPYAHMVRQGQVWLPDAADWADEWIDEHADFPGAAYDDQVDVGAYAAKLAHGWNPAQSPQGTGRAVPDPGEAAIMAALGNGHHGRDPLDMI